MSRPPVRLVATDLDGTLLRPDGSVSPRTREVLAQLVAAGVPLVLVTARPMRWMADLADLPAHGRAVVSNGAVEMDLPTGRPLQVTGIEPADGLDIVAELRAAVPGSRFAVETVDGLVLEPGYEEPEPLAPDTPVGPLPWVWAGSGLKILLRHPPEADAAAVRTRVAAVVGERAVPTWSVDGLVEIGPPGVTKATTLARVAASLGVSAAETIAFGDMPNDLAMLGWAGRGYAVANAHPQVRSAADEVVPGNDVDGVARTLEALLC